eukprot:TRINITY_DN104430_c0_g1_i1.p1 TRINITY_DN104430_c0_g1~~TRINITY_DN104430_c0_g1_i1.p1  ORF type:complete len:318 (-),score=41.51 TRINITY_DN104430_c0_g1_i1:154-1107(-)
MPVLLTCKSRLLCDVAVFLGPADSARFLPAFLCANWGAFRADHATQLLQLWKHHLRRAGVALQFDFKGPGVAQQLAQISRACGVLHRITTVFRSSTGAALITFRQQAVFEAFVQSMDTICRATPRDHELFFTELRIPMIADVEDGDGYGAVLRARNGDGMQLTLEYGTGEDGDLQHTLFARHVPRLVEGGHVAASHKAFFVLLDEAAADPDKMWKHSGSWGCGCRISCLPRELQLFSVYGAAGFMVGPEVDAWLDVKRAAAAVSVASEEQAEAGGLLVVFALKFQETDLDCTCGGPLFGVGDHDTSCPHHWDALFSE